MTGRESCRQFESTDEYGAVMWQPNRAGERLTAEPLQHSREMDGEDGLHGGGELGVPSSRTRMQWALRRHQSSCASKAVVQHCQLSSYSDTAGTCVR